MLRPRRRIMGLPGLTKTARVRHDLLMLGIRSPAHGLNSVLRHLERDKTSYGTAGQYRAEQRRAKRAARLAAAFRHAVEEQTRKPLPAPRSPAKRLWDGKEYRDRAGRLVGVWRLIAGQFHVVPL